MSRVVSLEIWTAVAVVALCAFAHQVVKKLLWEGLWTPLRLRSILMKQGVQAPPFRFLVGDLMEAAAYRDTFPDVVPLDSWKNLSPTTTPLYALFFPKFPGAKYFLYSFGTSTRLVVRDPEIAREVFLSNDASLDSAARGLDFLERIVGKGLALNFGEKWSTERRTISPFFHHGALQGMVQAMVGGMTTEICKWEQIVAQAGGTAEINVEPDMRKLTGRVLSLTAFGGEYETGVQVSKIQIELGNRFFNMFKEIGFWVIPYYRYLSKLHGLFLGYQFFGLSKQALRHGSS